jgi:UDP-2,3-diacylglucosamine hydrolase
LSAVTAHLDAPCLIVSDAHLGSAPAEAERTLIAFFDGPARSARSVVINGDLFDFWIEWRHVMPRAGYRALAAIAAARESGVSITWIAGNHDCWGGEVLQEAGVAYHVGAWRGTIGPWKTVIEHGDGLREVEDAPYRRLRTVLRNRLAIWAFRHLLHPDWATALARRSSHTSRNMRPRDGGAGLKRVAEERLRSDPSLELFVFGHTHADALTRGESGGVYANPGAWMDGPRCLRVTDRAIDLVEFRSNGAEAVLKSEARIAR